MSSTVYSTQNIFDLQLDVLPKSVQGIMDRAETESWPYVLTRNPLGGGSGGEIKLYTVPDYVHAAIAAKRFGQRSLARAMVDVPVPALTDRQRQIAAARVAILVHVRRLQAQFAHEGMFEKDAHGRAIRETLDAIRAGTLPEHIQAQVPMASARRDGKISRPTLYNWSARFVLGAPDAVERMAPAAHGVTRSRKWMIKHAGWMEPFLRLYGQPQKPTLIEAYRKLPAHLPDGVAVPSFGQVRNYMRKMGNVERQRGRLGEREIKTVLPFVRRDTSVLWPCDVYMADGHTFDAEVAHPAHGRAFRPEVTTVADVASKKIVGWSIDLAESGLAVLDAIRHAVQTHSIMSIFYVDRGSGYRNAVISGPVTGLLDRLGARLEHSIAYNSQARGMIERLHQMWVAAAKELPTYIGADMDKHAANAVHKKTRKDVKQFGTSRLLLPWPDFLRFAAEKVAAYNARPHSALPTFVDSATGKRRHMSPDELWARDYGKGGPAVELFPGEADQLFRPQRQCKVQRGEVRIFNNTYFSHDLTEFHGDTVRVGYDIHDASSVWVYAADGRWICKAGFEANKRAFFPENVLQQAARKRAEGRERRLQQHLDEVQAELTGGALTLDAAQGLTIPAVANMPDARAPIAPARGDAVPVVHGGDVMDLRVKRASFALPSERYEWLKRQVPETWTVADCAFLRDYVRDPDGYALFAQRFELLDVAWTDADAARIGGLIDGVEARRAVACG